MAIKHIVTLGFGFADGVKFIPTVGYTPSTVVVVAGPYRVVAAQVFNAGAVSGGVFNAGAAKAQVFNAGAVAGEVQEG